MSKENKTIENKKIENNPKKMTQKQGRETAELMSKLPNVDMTSEEIFESLVAEGRVSNGRGCESPFMEFVNGEYQIWKVDVLKRAKAKGLKQENSKGQYIDPSINHKAVK